MADIFRFDGTRFVRVPGSLRQIAVGSSTAVWGVNDDSDIFKFNLNTGFFEQVPGKLQFVRVGQTGEVWGLNANSDIFQLNSSTGLFDQVPGKLHDIEVAAGGFAWGINANSDIFIFENKINKQIPGKLEIISVGPHGNPWGINASSDIFRLNPDSFLFEQVPGKLTTITVGDDAPLENFAQVWGLNVRPRNPGDLFTFHDIFRFDLASGLFEQVPGELMIIAASAEDIWGINAFHDVFRFDPQARNFQGAFEPVPGQQLDAIAVGINGVWGLSGSQPPPH
jgi:hypothetical protein